jgi:hypothetical protein
MAQKPITLKQLGISFDDIVVHLQDRDIVRTVEKQVIKEVDPATINKIVSDYLASQPTINEDAVRQIINDEITKQELHKPEVTTQFVKKMIAGQSANFNEQGIKDLITLEVQKHLPKPEPKQPECIPANIDEHKLWATQEIDEASSNVRIKFITVAPGQESLYAEKVDEATDYIADGATDLSTFPLLRAEVNGTGKTTDEVVDGILSSKSRWIAINAQIEEIRLRAKTTINSADAVSGEEVDDIKNQAITLLQTL